MFPTARDASKWLGFGRTSVAQCANGINQTCGGYHWRYATEDEVPKRKPKKKVREYVAPVNIRPVYCEELDRIFPSVLAASKELHCSQCAINYSAKGKVKNPKKYHWHYVDEMERNEIKENDSASESETSGK